MWKVKTFFSIPFNTTLFTFLLTLQVGNVYLTVHDFLTLQVGNVYLTVHDFLTLQVGNVYLTVHDFNTTGGQCLPDRPWL